MRNEARRYVLSILIMLLVGVAYAQTQVDTETVLTKDSQAGIRSEFISSNDSDNSEKEEKAKADSEEAAEAGAEPAVPAAEAAESKARTFRATAYCLKGKTALGHRVRRGLIAADPRVLPLGTTVEIVSGKYSGTYLVSDTGKRVRGSKIDIWVPSCAEARRWGHRTVKLKVVKKKGRKT
jgi:3D (Asp-Asp-Asp) domain-containing protein